MEAKNVSPAVAVIVILLVIVVVLAVGWAITMRQAPDEGPVDMGTPGLEPSAGGGAEETPAGEIEESGSQDEPTEGEASATE